MDGLSVHSVSTAYGRRRVLEDIEVSGLARGTVTSVIGPNAAGKSTMLRVLAGLRTYTGSVCIDGSPLEAEPPASRGRRIAYLPQTAPGPAALTVYESVVCARRLGGLGHGDDDPEATDRVVHSLGIEDIAFRYLDELSGGQRQLVGIAQVLVRTPEILLLDEPTSSLDLHRQMAVLEAIRAAAHEQGMVVVIALHDLNLAIRFCDRVIVMGNGRIAAEGKPLEAIDNNILRRVYGVEARVEQCSRGTPIVLVDSALSPRMGTEGR